MEITSSGVNTILLVIGVPLLVYIWRITRHLETQFSAHLTKLETLLLGINGGGALKEIDKLRERMYELSQTLTVLNANVTQLTSTVDRWLDRGSAK